MAISWHTELQNHRIIQVERDHGRCLVQPAQGRVCYVIRSGCSELYPIIPSNKNLKMETARGPWTIGSNAWLSLQRKNFLILSQNLPWFNLSLIFPSHTCSFVKNLAPSSQRSPHRHWEVAITSPSKLSLLEAKQAQFSQRLLTSHVLQFPVILMALCRQQHPSCIRVLDTALHMLSKKCEVKRNSHFAWSTAMLLFTQARTLLAFINVREYCSPHLVHFPRDSLSPFQQSCNPASLPVLSPYHCRGLVCSRCSLRVCPGWIL